MGVLVEVLSFEGCPHTAPAVALARRVVDEAGVSAEICIVEVADEETQRQRFLGSPSIRVDGFDVEPGADSRRDYAHGCRLYATSTGRHPLPDEAWLRSSLVADYTAASKQVRTERRRRRSHPPRPHASAGADGTRRRGTDASAAPTLDHLLIVGPGAA